MEKGWKEPRPSVLPRGPTSVFLMTNSFDTGGSERQFSILAQSLNRDRFQVRLGCLKSGGPFQAGLVGVEEFQLGGSLYGLASVRARVRLGRRLRREGVHIAHAFDFYAALTLVPAARLGGVPIVVGSHRQIGDLLTRAQLFALVTSFRCCDAIVCNSQAAADRLMEHGLKREKLVVIGNALPAEAFASVDPLVPRSPGMMRVGMVARMNEHCKNHSGFLRVAARVHRECPNVEFLLAGDGPLRGELEREAQRLGVGRAVKFLGDQRSTPAVNASLDVAVLTSNSESLSNVILEAMAAGVPVVAYRCGGNPELVNEERGSLIGPGDERGFAEAILQLVRQPSLREQAGRNARRFVIARFSLESVVGRYEELYANLTRERGLPLLR